MSFEDVGKDAKVKGATHPKHLPLPADRVTPARKPKVKAEKPFGLTYEISFGLKAKEPRKWKAERRWFKTERHRDQTFEKEAASQAKWDGNWIIQYRSLTKVSR